MNRWKLVSFICAAVLVGLLLAACREDEGADLGPEPWTVVATTLDLDRDQRDVTIVYFAPGGGTQTWKRRIDTRAFDPERPSWFEPIERWARCWESAVIGEPLPECARSEPRLTEERPAPESSSDLPQRRDFGAVPIPERSTVDDAALPERGGGR